MQCEYQMHNNNLSCQLLKKLNYIEQGEVSRQIWSEIRKTAESVICLGTTRVSGKNQEQSWQKQKKKKHVFRNLKKLKKKKNSWTSTDPLRGGETKRKVFAGSQNEYRWSNSWQWKREYVIDHYTNIISSHSLERFSKQRSSVFT